MTFKILNICGKSI